MNNTMVTANGLEPKGGFVQSRNLVSNAIHYSPTETPIQITTRSDDGAVVVSIHNQGAPIPVELQRNIFEPFKRGRVTRASRSLGLGLYIVERIVSAHGGAVECRSTASEGTTFFLTLPRQARQAEAAPTTSLSNTKELEPPSGGN